MQIKPRWLWCCLILLLVAACGHKEEPSSSKEKGRTVKVSLHTLSPAKVHLFRELPGTVEARVRARLSSKVSGFVREVRVEEGDRVRKGELLVRIEDREIQERVKALQAAIRALQNELAEVDARLAFARAEFERYRRLFKEEAVTAEEFEAKRSEFRALSARKKAVVARLQELRARLAGVRSLLPYTRIRAPFEGRVVHKRVQEGTFVAPGVTLLEIESLSAGKRLVFHPPEELLSRVKVGQEIQAYFPSLGKGFPLRISEVVPDVEPGSRTFTVRADLPEDLPSGLFARVFLPVGEVIKLLVPESAVVDRGGFQGVFVADEKGRLHFRVVRLGKTYYRHKEGYTPVCPEGRCESFREVLSGLRSGERVVLAPPEGLREGDRVEGGR